MSDMKPGEREFIEKMVLDLTRDAVKPQAFSRPGGNGGWRPAPRRRRPERRRKYF